MATLAGNILDFLGVLDAGGLRLLRLLVVRDEGPTFSLGLRRLLAALLGLLDLCGLCAGAFDADTLRPKVPVAPTTVVRVTCYSNKSRSMPRE